MQDKFIFRAEVLAVPLLIYPGDCFGSGDTQTFSHFANDPV